PSKSPSIPPPNGELRPGKGAFEHKSGVLPPVYSPIAGAPGGGINAADYRADLVGEGDNSDTTPGPDDRMWNVPWLDDLRSVPDDAWWPRIMSAPHPLAVGSY